MGFFLTIGLSGLPSLSDLGVAVLLVLAVPIKVALFLVSLTRVKLRAWTSTLTSRSAGRTERPFASILGYPTPGHRPRSYRRPSGFTTNAATAAGWRSSPRAAAI